MFYVDTSVLALPLLNQEGGDAVERFLIEEISESELVSSVLLEVELIRVAKRSITPSDTAQSARMLLDEIHLIDIDREVVENACGLTDSLKSLDAIHLGTALILHCERDPVVMLTHDDLLAATARRLGVEVVDPAA